MNHLIPRRTSDMDLYFSMMLPSAGKQGKGILCTWLGTAGVCLSDSDTGLLIDPYVSRFGPCDVAFRRPLVPDRDVIRAWARSPGRVKIRAVIVSHSHFDHVADAPLFARETGALLVGSESTINVGRGAGLEEKQMRIARPGQTMRFGSFSVRFLESRHGPFLMGRVPYAGDIAEPLVQPAMARDYRVGTVFSLLLRHPEGSIIHHGSAGFIPGMYDDSATDVLLLGIAGRNHTPGYVKHVAARTEPKLLIPIHADNFFRPLRKGMALLPSIAFRKFFNECASSGSIGRIGTLAYGTPVRILPITGPDLPREALPDRPPR